jgi:putative Mg2+ transporter-C (MgtC) family protein
MHAWLAIGNPPDLGWEMQMVIRLVLAALLGGLIGLEREVHGRSAGMRTQMLVGLGAALAMVVSLHFGEIYGMTSSDSTLRIDPARMAYGVMGGVGFLGAGAIIQSGLGIRGLTTAASLWCTAAVGLACGFGMFLSACVTALLTLFALGVLGVLDRYLPQHHYKRLTISVAGSATDAAERFRQMFVGMGMKVQDVHLTRNYQRDTSTLTFHVRMRSPSELEKLIHLADEQTDLRHLKID